MAKTNPSRSYLSWGAVWGVLTHPVLFFFVAAGGIVGGALWSWNQFSDGIRIQGRWRLTETRIEISSGLPWYAEAHARRLTEMLAAEQHSLTDAHLIRRAVELVAAEPFVAKVDSATKTHRGLTIAVRYRLPVAWIGDDTLRRFIDAQGVIVVPDIVASDDAHPLPRLLMPDLVPHRGLDWALWPDPRVIEGARVCEEIAPRAPAWGVNRVITYWRNPQFPSRESPWELWTPQGARVLYRDAAVSDAVTAAKRIEAIDQWIATHGSLSAIPPGYVLDIRDGRAQLVPELRAVRHDQPWR